MNQPPSKPLIAFDFDGVLVDSFDVTFDVSHRLAGTVDHEAFRKYFEGNIYETVAKHVETNKTHHEDFNTALAEQIWKLPPVTGMADAIHLLSENYELVIVTSNLTPIVLRWLSMHGLEQRFSAVLGGDVERSKSKKLASVAHETGQHVFVTDSLGDLLEANDVGLPTIAVTWGFHERWRLEKGKPGTIIDSPWDLVPAIQTTLANTTIK